MGAVVVYLLFWCGAGGLVGYAIGNSKGRGTQGLLLGLLFGVIGWLIVAVMEPSDHVRHMRQAETIALARSLATPPRDAERLGGSERDARSSTGRRRCPWCAETIQSAAIICRFCGRNVEPIESIAPSPAPRQSSYAERPELHRSTNSLEAFGTTQVVRWTAGDISIASETGRWTFPASSVVSAKIEHRNPGRAVLTLLALNRPAQHVEFATTELPKFEEFVEAFVPPDQHRD
jgi:hypothetical protein